MIKETITTTADRAVHVNGKESVMRTQVTMKPDGNFKVSSFLTTVQVSHNEEEMNAIFIAQREEQEKLIQIAMQRRKEILDAADEADANQLSIEE